jgi:mono/diheme cytochrome c family protein
MQFISKIIMFIVLLMAAAALFIYSGTFDVAATSPHSSLMTWVMATTRENAISRDAQGIKAPPLNTPAMADRGFDHYQEHCEVCHGAPGNYPTELGEGMNPAPPKLWEVARRRTPAELFWVIKNGIKMTGMPANTDHTDSELWDIVAFVKKLPGMTPQAYTKMKQASEQSDSTVHDHHGTQEERHGMKMPGQDHGSHAHPGGPSHSD